MDSEDSTDFVDYTESRENKKKLQWQNITSNGG